MFTFWPELVPILIVFLVLNFGLTFFFTRLTLVLAHKIKIVDNSKDAPHRKDQTVPVPLLGATSFIFFSLLFTGLIWLLRKQVWADNYMIQFFNITNLHELLGTNLEAFKLFWVYVGILIIVAGGLLDDVFHFKSKINFFPTLFALLIIIYLGDIKIDAFSEPFSNWLPPSVEFRNLLTFLWLGFCLSATKFLDGLDGLVSSVGVVSFLIIAGTSSLAIVNQPLVFAISLIWAFGILGFLPYNLPNAKLYLGEAGSQIIGLMVGILSIISGAKIATATTVIGWFILDFLLVMLVRVVFLKKSPLEGDKLHWHFRLQALGLNKTQVLLITVGLLVITGTLGVILPTEYKLYLILAQILTSVIFFAWSLKKTWNKLV